MIKFTSKFNRLYKSISPKSAAKTALIMTFALRLVLMDNSAVLAQDRNYNDYSLLALTSMPSPNKTETDDEKSLIFQNDMFAQSLPLISSMNISDKTKDSKSSSKTVSYQIVESKRVLVTAYSSTPDQTDDSPFISANGTRVHDGMVACNFLPFGTKIKLPEYSGDKIYVVEDRMAKRNSHKLDIWMETRADAMKFGVRHLTVVVVK